MASSGVSARGSFGDQMYVGFTTQAGKHADAPLSKSAMEDYGASAGGTAAAAGCVALGATAAAAPLCGAIGAFIGGYVGGFFADAYEAVACFSGLKDCDPVPLDEALRPLLDRMTASMILVARGEPATKQDIHVLGEEGIRELHYRRDANGKRLNEPTDEWFDAATILAHEINSVSEGNWLFTPNGPYSKDADPQTGMVPRVKVGRFRDAANTRGGSDRDRLQRDLTVGAANALALAGDAFLTAKASADGWIAGGTTRSSGVLPIFGAATIRNGSLKINTDSGTATATAAATSKADATNSSSSWVWWLVGALAIGGGVVYYYKVAE